MFDWARTTIENLESRISHNQPSKSNKPALKLPFFTRECTTALKGIAIVLVIFGHRGLIDGAGSWGVLIFLVLSGYGIFKSTQRKGLAGYWRSRIVGVLVPYALFSVLQLGLSFTLGERVGAGNVLCTLMGLDFGLNVDPTMWYISFIFVCYAVFCGAWCAYEQRGAVAFTLVLLVAFVLVATVGLSHIVWHKGTAAWTYFWAFPAGALLAMYEKRLLGGSISLAVYIFAIVAALVAVVHMYGTLHGSLNLLVYSTAGAVLVTLLVKFLMNSPAGIVLVKALRPLGNVSYSMYLNEGFLIRLDGYIPFVMGPLLTLVFSFVFASLWNWLIADRVTGWLKRRHL